MSTFEDPFTGTPIAATKREMGNNASPLEKARRGIIYEDDGLFGMKDIDGTPFYPAKYYFIGKCKDYVMFLEPTGSYCKMSPGCTESGYMAEEDRPYVENGKAGFKKDGKVIIPAEYDYIRPVFFGNTVFIVVRDGREYYINDKGREVLTRVKRFEGESDRWSPFWLRTNEFDFVTAMDYVGHEDENNPNVVQIDGQWVELERYSRDEILDMIINPEDDLALTTDDTGLLCERFSYEYSFYFANADGGRPLEKCMRQLEKMNAFDNTWHFTAKLLQAPGEHVSAKDLRKFYDGLGRKKALGSPVLAVGHSAALKPGEVRVLLVTYYNERCFPPQWEFDWFDKCSKLPITALRREAPSLRETIEKDILEEYREDDFKALVRDCLSDLNYEDGFDWDATQEALDYFRELGSSMDKTLCTYSSKALEAATGNGTREAEFFLRAAQWALENGACIDLVQHSCTALDFAEELQKKCRGGENEALVMSLHAGLLKRGAITYAERMENDDYYRELKFLRP